MVRLQLGAYGQREGQRGQQKTLAAAAEHDAGPTIPARLQHRPIDPIGCAGIVLVAIVPGAGRPEHPAGASAPPAGTNPMRGQLGAEDPRTRPIEQTEGVVGRGQRIAEVRDRRALPLRETPEQLIASVGRAVLQDQQVALTVQRPEATRPGCGAAQGVVGRRGRTR